MNTEGDPFVTYRRRKSRYTGEFEDIQLEDIGSEMEQTGYTLIREKEQEKRRTGWSFTT